MTTEGIAFSQALSTWLCDPRTTQKVFSETEKKEKSKCRGALPTSCCSKWAARLDAS